ncbi:MAG: hypothetical protein CM15mP62_01790 [Rhodospirillaceae bacterium]|nr:MAG: hypothetical protein CM15mP62_01790 [Rhodospirillaceae bacterium]
MMRNRPYNSSTGAVLYALALFGEQKSIPQSLIELIFKLSEYPK